MRWSTNTFFSSKIFFVILCSIRQINKSHLLFHFCCLFLFFKRPSNHAAENVVTQLYSSSKQHTVGVVCTRNTAVFHLFLCSKLFLLNYFCLLSLSLYLSRALSDLTCKPVHTLTRFWHLRAGTTLPSHRMSPCWLCQTPWTYNFTMWRVVNKFSICLSIPLSLWWVT